MPARSQIHALHELGMVVLSPGGSYEESRVREPPLQGPMDLGILTLGRYGGMKSCSPESNSGLTIAYRTL